MVRKLGGPGSTPDITFGFFADFQILENGNIVATNWHGHEANSSSKGDQILEFDTAGKIVWKWHDPQRAGSIHAVIVLDNLDPNLHYDDINGPMQPVEKH